MKIPTKINLMRKVADINSKQFTKLLKVLSFLCQGLNICGCFRCKSYYFSKLSWESDSHKCTDKLGLKVLESVIAFIELTKNKIHAYLVVFTL
jgi:hypothetical protein